MRFHCITLQVQQMMYHFSIHYIAKLNSSDADKATGFPSGGKRTSSPQNRKSSAGYGRRKSNKAHVQVRFKPGH